MADYGTLSADGQSDTYTVKGNTGVWVHQSGDYGSGGATKIQMLAKDAATWKDIAGSGFSAADDSHYYFPHLTKIRLDLSGSTSPTLFWQFHSTKQVM